MPVDPRLNCAAEICCAPVPPISEGSVPTRNPESLRSAAAILKDCGVPEDLAPKVAKEMHGRGIVFLSAELATAIRNIAFPA